MKGALRLISTNFSLCQSVQCLSEETITDLVSVPCRWGALNVPHLPLSLGTVVMSALGHRAAFSRRKRKGQTIGNIRTDTRTQHRSSFETCLT